MTTTRRPRFLTLDEQNARRVACPICSGDRSEPCRSTTGSDKVNATAHRARVEAGRLEAAARRREGWA